MDPEEAKRFLPFKPYDQTSNQRLAYEQIISPENRELFSKTVEEGKDEGWEVILDRMVSHFVYLDSSHSFTSSSAECPAVRQKHGEHPGAGVASDFSFPRIRH
jgi:hypothetical protein